MPIVRMPDGAEVSFPDDMPREQIKSLIASKFPESVPQSAPQEQAPQEGFQRSTILPLGKDLATGEISMAVPGILQGLFESGKAAVTAPGRAYSGELQVMGPDGHVTPEAIAEGANFAMMASPSSMANGSGKLISIYDDVARGARPGAGVAAAGNRLGVQVPRAASSDSMAIQQMGKVVSNVPIGGTPIRRAAERAIGQLDDAALRVERGYGTGSVANAGSVAREGLTNQAKNVIPGRVSAKYDKVDALVTPNVVTPLKNTSRIAADIAARRANAKMAGDSKAVALVQKALDEPGGLNYQGIKDLRSSIGELVDDPAKLAASGIEKGDLSKIYAGLSDDLRTSVERSGGSKALDAFNSANTFAAKKFAERKDLQKIVGKQSSDEAIFAKIQAMAGSTSRADQSSLMKVRGTVDKAGWDEITSAVLSKMGRDADGNFTPDRFLTAYGKLSPTGKHMLFRSTGKKDLANSLDDIAEVSRRFKQLNQFANPSGTGQTVIGGSYLAGAFLDPMTVVSTIAGTNVLARVLAKPQIAKTMADYSKAYEQALKSQSAASSKLLTIRAKTLANALANDAGNAGLSAQIYPAISMVRKAPAQPEEGDKGGAEGQNESPDKQPSGLIEPGNLDLTKRPKVRNKDGSYSTVRSMSFNEDGQEILIPTVSKSGSILTDEGAIALYHATGEHLGKFRSPEDADAYAQELHNSQAKMYGQ